MTEHTPAPNPTRGVYGFAVFLLFKSLFIIYMIWALLPQSFLEGVLGLTYLPDKYFAIVIPILILTGATLFGILIYPSMGLALTANIDDIRTIRDEFSIARCKHGTCNMKIESSDENVCSIHLHMMTTSSAAKKENDLTTTGAASLAARHVKENEFNNIENYCDCVDKGNCLLSNENLNYLNEIENRKHIPTVSDLDIADVCRKLYLNQ